MLLTMSLQLRITAAVSYLNDCLRRNRQNHLKRRQWTNTYQTGAQGRIASILVDEARVWNEVKLLCNRKNKSMKLNRKWLFSQMKLLAETWSCTLTFKSSASQQSREGQQTAKSISTSANNQSSEIFTNQSESRAADSVKWKPFAVTRSRWVIFGNENLCLWFENCMFKVRGGEICKQRRRSMKRRKAKSPTTQPWTWKHSNDCHVLLEVFIVYCTFSFACALFSIELNGFNWIWAFG